LSVGGRLEKTICTACKAVVKLGRDNEVERWKYSDRDVSDYDSYNKSKNSFLNLSFILIEFTTVCECYFHGSNWSNQ